MVIIRKCAILHTLINAAAKKGVNSINIAEMFHACVS